jgi:hypothetical protein
MPAFALTHLVPDHVLAPIAIADFYQWAERRILGTPFHCDFTLCSFLIPAKNRYRLIV